jgi:hypothetical protein
VSSRLLSRALKKAGIPITTKAHSIIEIQDELKVAYKHYYSLKKDSKERETHLEKLESAMATKENF